MTDYYDNEVLASNRGLVRSENAAYRTLLLEALQRRDAEPLMSFPANLACTKTLGE